MKNKRNNILIIILYSLLLIIILVGTKNIYGSNIDWTNQHTVFPEIFRNTFYETKRLIPNYIFNLGAGQNIFNYSYYGLMSPLILISYLLPFINMKIYIAITSIILYILSGLLLFKFLEINKTSSKISLLTTIAFQTLAPITYHFHHHIMFVWYLPFLLMALLGVEHYLKQKKSSLLIISVFLMILTNYYYSVSSILVITIYGIYKLLQKEKFTIKNFLKEILKASIRIILPILMASFILIPTLMAMSSSKRTNASPLALKALFLPNIEEILYSSFSIGLTFLLLITPLGNLCKKKKNNAEIFLNTTLVLVSFFPVIMYILNGTLYVRGKVLIPFLILYMFSLTTFITNLKEAKINIKNLKSVIIIVVGILLIINIKSYFLLALLLDAIITCLSLKYYIKKKKLKILYIPLIITILISSIANNKTEIYAPINTLNKEKTIEKLLTNLEDDGLYRTINMIKTNQNVNKIYNNNYYSTSQYSSTYNPYYLNFYHFKIGNNIERRNMLNTSGANNYLFNKFMSVKYIISDKEEDYPKIATKKGINLYKNDDYNPLIYTAEEYGNRKKYEELAFPDNLEYLMNYQVIEGKPKESYQRTVEKLNFNLKEEYKFSLKKGKKITYPLPTKITDKLLIISFDMNYNSSCNKKDVYIKINGIKNTLTCKEWLYHNKNNNFTYVISTKKRLDELEIYLAQGKYHISNINIYTMDYPKPKLQELENIKINKKDSLVTGKVNLKNSKYVITSFPFDEGFSVYVDNNKVQKELVNTAFLGFKVPRGKHNIKIKYTSKGYNLGKILSKIAAIISLLLIIIEKRQKIIQRLTIK